MDVVVEVIIVVTCAAEMGSACVVVEEIIWLLKPITLVINVRKIHCLKFSASSAMR